MTSKKKKRIRKPARSPREIEAKFYLPPHVKKVFGCMRTLLEVRQDLERSYQSVYDYLEKHSATCNPSVAVADAGYVFRKRMVENGHRLLAKVITDLLEFVAIEAGVDGIGRLVYPWPSATAIKSEKK
jgi:hypothetical protein